MLTSALQRCASVGEVAALLQGGGGVIEEGMRRAGGGVGEAVGEARGLSRWGEAVEWASRASRVWGRQAVACGAPRPLARR